MIWAMSYERRLSALTLGLTLVSFGLFGQSNSGEISGTVYDPSKAVISQVKVIAINLATNVTESVTTNKDGLYSLPSLSPGTTTGLHARKDRFQKRWLLANRSPSRVGLPWNWTLTFPSAASSTEVTIVADVPIIQNATSTIQYGLDLKQIDELPMVNQSAIQILGLLPGVAGEPGSEQAAVTTGFTVPGAGLSVSGSPMGTVQFQADGVSNTRLYYGRISLALSSDAISEMQVVQNSYSAEYRSGGGAVVSMTTKSGTNQIHGTMFSFSQNDDLNAAPWLKYNKKGLQRYWRGGVDIGGPVRIPKLYNGRNKTFFFANYEPLRQYTQSQFFIREATALERQGQLLAVRRGRHHAADRDLSAL